MSMREIGRRPDHHAGLADRLMQRRLQRLGDFGFRIGDKRSMRDLLGSREGQLGGFRAHRFDFAVRRLDGGEHGRSDLANRHRYRLGSHDIA